MSLSMRLRPFRGRMLAILFVAASVTGCTLLIDEALDGKSGGTGGSPAGTGGHGGSPASSSASTTSSNVSGAGGATSSTTTTAATSSSSGAGSSCDGGCSLPNATAGCSMGACVIVSCAPNYADCDMMPGDGCEAALKSDVAHCGACDIACDAGASCKGGKCK